MRRDVSLTVKELLEKHAGHLVIFPKDLTLMREVFGKYLDHLPLSELPQARKRIFDWEFSHSIDC